MNLILTILAVFVLLVGSELWFRRHSPHSEFSRKFIHIVVGSFAAFWPFYLPWSAIIFMSLSFVVVVLISKYFDVFRAIHTVERPTWGEVYFALAVGALAYITHEPWIYAAALLHMSLADGLAAVIGVTYGRAQSYTVLGHRKSLAGTLTFFIVSIAILSLFNIYGAAIGIGVIISLAVATTFIENIGVRGLDNLLVPLVIGVVLTRIN